MQRNVEHENELIFILKGRIPLGTKDYTLTL